MIGWVHFEYFMQPAVVRSQCLSVAHLFDDDAVVTSAVQAQVLQDGSDLQQSQPVAGGGARGGDVKTAASTGLQKHRLCACVCVLLPLYLREELCFKDASGLQRFRNLPSEQESSLGHIDQDVPHNLTQI